eukprot:370440_1
MSFWMPKATSTTLDSAPQVAPSITMARTAASKAAMSCPASSGFTSYTHCVDSIFAGLAFFFEAAAFAFAAAALAFAFFLALAEVSSSESANRSSESESDAGAAFLPPLALPAPAPAPEAPAVTPVAGANVVMELMCLNHRNTLGYLAASGAPPKAVCRSLSATVAEKPRTYDRHCRKRSSAARPASDLVSKVRVKDMV